MNTYRPARQRLLKTWQGEVAVVATIMATTSYLTGGSLPAWLSAAAVTMSFAHGQVSDRMVEQEAVRPKPSVHCYRTSTHYFLLKEALWCLVFLSTHTYPALGGVFLFLLYPVWRKVWRRYHPMETR